VRAGYRPPQTLTSGPVRLLRLRQPLGDARAEPPGGAVQVLPAPRLRGAEAWKRPLQRVARWRCERNVFALPLEKALGSFSFPNRPCPERLAPASRQRQPRLQCRRLPEKTLSSTSLAAPSSRRARAAPAAENHVRRSVSATRGTPPVTTARRSARRVPESPRRGRRPGPKNDRGRPASRPERSGAAKAEDLSRIRRDEPEKGGGRQFPTRRARHEAPRAGPRAAQPESVRGEAARRAKGPGRASSRGSSGCWTGTDERRAGREETGRRPSRRIDAWTATVSGPRSPRRVEKRHLARASPSVPSRGE